MLNQTDKEKIKRFLADEVMTNAVKSVLREAFLKNSGSEDVQTLASERMAINLLEDGFKELRKHSNREDTKAKEIRQVGL